MNQTALKKRLEKREATIGSWITLGHTSVAEVLCQAGFDWLVVDMEHSAITLDMALQLIQVIDLSQVAPLVRISENDPTLIKRVMDCGAHGIVVPMVNSAAEAAAAVSAVRYPPSGSRGVGLTRAQEYGFGFEDYRQRNSEESVVIVQIEHIDAVRNLEAILEVEGVDGFIVGPYDLSASLGKPGRFDDAAVQDALREVETIAGDKNALAGFHVVPVDYAELQAKLDAGYRFLGHSLDTLWLGTQARSSVESFRKATGK